MAAGLSATQGGGMAAGLSATQGGGMAAGPSGTHVGLVTATALTPTEVTAIAPRVPAGAIVVVRGGAAQVVSGDAGKTIDVARWIDLDALVVVEAQALAAPPVVAAVPVAAAKIDVRATAGVAPAADGAEGLRAALARAGGRTAAAQAGAAQAGADGGRATAVGPSWWQRIVRWLSARMTPPSTAANRSGTGGAAAARTATDEATAIEPAPPRPGWLRRMRDRLAEAMWRSRLGDALGRRHAEYLQRMLEMFDRGEIDEALRHAIPIGGGDEDGPTSLALATPRRRDDVELSMVPRRGGAAIPVGDLAQAQIRARYRAAVERLIQQGRIDEAAFVLADLLGDLDGAIALLERHGKHALAARLAEGHARPPGLIIRLWFLAGDRTRAVAVARRQGGWADAIARLERAREPGVDELRLLWADQLASAGDYGQAVEVAWPVASAHGRTGVGLIRTWIERGLEAGGTTRARLLIRELTRAPARFAELLPAVRAVIDDADEDAAWDRLALAETVVASPTSPELRAIARASVRALLRDIGRGADGDAPTLLPRLVRFADDAALRADQPVLRARTRPTSLVDRDQPLRRRWSADDAGPVVAHDAAWLPGGRLLVALGELGVRVYNREGRVVAHLEQPATELVVSDHGSHALALIRRGGYLRVARLDLTARRAAHWCDVECDGWARTYDGDTWLTTRGNEVLAIDPTAARWTASWGVDLDDRRARDLRRQGPRWSVEAAHVEGNELWFYERFLLRARRDVLLRGAADSLAHLTAARPEREDWVELAVPHPPPGESPDPCQLWIADAAMPIDVWSPRVIELDARFVAVAGFVHRGQAIEVGHAPQRKLIVRLDLDGARRASLRLCDFVLAICDDRGRVIAVDLRTGAIRADLRLTV